MSISFDLPTADHFTTGAEGDPGDRVFYLQVRGEGIVVTLKVEKEQVAALADYLANVLADLPAPDRQETPSSLALLEPVVEQWAVGTLGIAWDPSADRVLLVAEELVSDDERESGTEPATARFRVTRAQADAFVAHARDLVTAGRPPCPLCGGPLDPEGHVCPRTNGHRKLG